MKTPSSPSVALTVRPVPPNSSLLSKLPPLRRIAWNCQDSPDPSISRSQNLPESAARYHPNFLPVCRSSPLLRHSRNASQSASFSLWIATSPIPLPSDLEFDPTSGVQSLILQPTELPRSVRLLQTVIDLRNLCTPSPPFTRIHPRLHPLTCQRPHAELNHPSSLIFLSRSAPGAACVCVTLSTPNTTAPSPPAPSQTTGLVFVNHPHVLCVLTRGRGYRVQLRELPERSSSPSATSHLIIVTHPAATMTPTRFLPAIRPCCVRSTSLITTDRARAPQVRLTVPCNLRQVNISFSVSLTVSAAIGFSISECLDDIDRIQITVQPVGLTVELPSATHSPTPARTWTGRHPGRTLLGAPQGLRRRRPRRYSAWLHH